MAATPSVFPESGKGTYILVLRLSTPIMLAVGRLGAYPFPAGWCAYVGSAFGAGGLAGRLKHHLTVAPRPHWHIDYLRQVAPVAQVWYRVADLSYEHEWAAQLSAIPGTTIPVPRFGASDCTCAAHLFHFPAPPDFSIAGSNLHLYRVF
ncbi:MAG: GIY-YIG nuclease family protein [Anaerolineae bacterium]|nr:GIY-YIG nuclease family protein [Anaerolineae bacterium]